MDIFKLIYEHDIILEHLAGTEDPRHTAKKELSIEDFMKPQPTYTKYYFTGTRLDKQQFGFTALEHHKKLCAGLAEVFNKYTIRNSKNSVISADELFLEPLAPHRVYVLHKDAQQAMSNVADLQVDEQGNVRDKLPELTKAMNEGFIIVYTEKAHDGTDLHFFSARNLYEFFFTVFQPRAFGDLRYFSINGKKVKSERNFYFETWTLERPPHGFEEVTMASRLR